MDGMREPNPGTPYTAPVQPDPASVRAFVVVLPTRELPAVLTHEEPHE